LTSFEILLILGVFCFYVYDSILVLASNEFIIYKSESKWSYVYPGYNWRFLKKTLYVPNIFRPDLALFSAHWRFRTQHDNRTVSCNQLMEFISHFKYYLWFLYCLMFICLPAVIYLYGQGIMLLSLFFLVYLNIIFILLIVWKNKKLLLLDNVNLAKICFESLACPPFALNIIRKITINIPVVCDPLIFAEQEFDIALFKKLLIDITERVDGLLVHIDEGHRDFYKLCLYKNRLDGIKNV